MFQTIHLRPTRTRAGLVRRMGGHLVRHASLCVFALIALALLTGPGSAPARAHGDHAVLLAAAADGEPQLQPQPGPGAGLAWLSPQLLAGLAALVVAAADAAAKVIRAVRQDGSLAVCPFSADGVSRCHGRDAPLPPEPRR